MGLKNTMSTAGNVVRRPLRSEADCSSVMILSNVRWQTGLSRWDAAVNCFTPTVSVLVKPCNHLTKSPYLKHFIEDRAGNNTFHLPAHSERVMEWIWSVFWLLNRLWRVLTIPADQRSRWRKLKLMCAWTRNAQFGKTWNNMTVTLTILLAEHLLIQRFVCTQVFGPLVRGFHVPLPADRSTETRLRQPVIFGQPGDASAPSDRHHFNGITAARDVDQH